MNRIEGTMPAEYLDSLGPLRSTLATIVDLPQYMVQCSIPGAKTLLRIRVALMNG